MSGLRPLLATAGLERARLRLFSRPLETMRVPTSTTTFLLFNAFYSFYPVSSTACPEKRAKLVAKASIQKPVKTICYSLLNTLVSWALFRVGVAGYCR